MNLADRVKLKREEKGLSQEELAKRMGYASRSSINKIEMGRPVSQKIIVRLADVLDTTPSWLMGWDEATSEEKEKSDATADITCRLLEDSSFFTVVNGLYNLSQEQFKDAVKVLDLFFKHSHDKNEN